MLAADRSDGGQQWTDHIGRIEPPAESCFDDGDINAAFAKIVEGKKRRQLKKSGISFSFSSSEKSSSNPWTTASSEISSPLIAILFPKGKEMRRGIEPNAISGELENFCDFRGDGAFAVAAGNMDGWIRRGRKGKRLVQRMGIVKVILGA